MSDATAGVTAKFLHSYAGPYVIAKVIPPSTFELTFTALASYCNVHNIDWLAVALDEPECAGKDSLAQLVNTGQPCFYKYLLFKVCAPK